MLAVGKNHFKRDQMYEKELNEKLRKIKNYQGSFAIDELNEISLSKLPSFFVINMDRRISNGSHWIAIAVYMNNVYVCDPLGGIIPDNVQPQPLIDFLDTILTTRKLNMTCQLQPSYSDLCGHYCVLFVKEMDQNNCFKCFLNLFSRDKNDNDEIVKFLNKQI